MNDIVKAQLRIMGFLTISGGLGYLSATYIANDPMLTAICANGFLCMFRGFPHV